MITITGHDIREADRLILTYFNLMVRHRINQNRRNSPTDFGNGVFASDQDPEEIAEVIGIEKAKQLYRDECYSVAHELAATANLANRSFASACVDFQHFTGRPFVATEDPVIDWKEFDEDGHHVLMGRVTVRGKPYELMIRAQIADIKFNPERWRFECEEAKARARREIMMLLSRGSGDDRI